MADNSTDDFLDKSDSEFDENVSQTQRDRDSPQPYIRSSRIPLQAQTNTTSTYTQTEEQLPSNRWAIFASVMVMLFFWEPMGAVGLVFARKNCNTVLQCSLD